MSKAEDNTRWVRERIAKEGLTDWIARMAYVRYIARYMNDQSVSEMFFEIVGNPA